MQIDTLEFDSDQTDYDYICNVTLQSSNNGNGMYDISILNKNFVQGFPIGKWRITKACLSYDWGNSYAYFIMTDEVGKETKKIRPIAHFAGWNSLQRLMNTGILSDSNVSAPKLTFKNAQ